MQPNERPQSIDQDLAKLALNAAKELDRLRRGENAQINHVREIADRLETESGVGRNDCSASYLSPTKVELIFDSTSSYTKQHGDLSADIYGQFAQIISDLKAVTASSEPGRLTQLVDFLVKFHDTLYSHQKNLSSARRPNSRFRV